MPGLLASMDEILEDVTRSAEARVGTRVNNTYVLDALLGVGGQAAVYAATHRNGSRVAVKMLHRTLSTDKEVRKRFLREGYVANAVHHEGVARVLSDGVHSDGSCFLVMDLLVGASAETIFRWKGGRVETATVVGIAYQLLDVVAAAHECGIVHRDIKPANISLTRDGVVKLLDFGVARINHSATSTRDGTTIGTPAFMSPEQALGKVKNIDAQSDVYSVGAVMFTMLSGLFVHRGESANEMMIMAATRQAPSLADVVSDVPDPLVKVVDRALRFDKRQRWPDALTMRDALREAYEKVYDEPIESGATLAGVLDGIEAVDFATIVGGDAWPTLLTAPKSKGHGPEDPVIEVSVSAHADDSLHEIRDSKRSRDWDDSTEVWDRHALYRKNASVPPPVASSTPSTPLNTRVPLWPMMITGLAVFVVGMAAWMAVDQQSRTRVVALLDQGAQRVQLVPTAPRAEVSLAPALRVFRQHLQVPSAATVPVDVYA